MEGIFEKQWGFWLKRLWRPQLPKQKEMGTGSNVVVSDQLNVAIDGQENGMKSESLVGSWE